MGGFTGDAGGADADAGGDADADAACDWKLNPCPWDDWTTCVFTCAQHHQAAFDLMRYKAIGPGCLGLCRPYCIVGDVDTCTDTTNNLLACDLCESIMFVNDEGISEGSVCYDADCKQLAACLKTCGAPPPSAPMPKGGSCSIDGGVSPDAPCCPDSPPIGEVCTGPSGCIYGPTRCVCAPGLTKWNCCPGGTPPSGPCAPAEKWTECVYDGPSGGTSTKCACDGLKWNCQ